MDPATMRAVIDRHIRAALAEDLNAGDVSTDAVVPGPRRARVDVVCKQEGTIAGTDVFARVFSLVDPATRTAFSVADGDRVRAGARIGRVEGDARVLLSCERTALNYLQRMSGIATYTRAMADALEGSGIVLLDTRKTTPTLRVFEKAAVRAGGGRNHRFNLSDAVMLKDNHIAAAGGIGPAVRAARARAPLTSRIEVECETIDRVREALAANADIIMLDNMGADQVRAAAAVIAGRAAVEVSGNVTLANVERYAQLPIDYLSSGALTHSAGILDLSMKHLAIEE